MDLRKLDKIKINFIIGHGRSGTTLLVFVFNRDRQCIATPEISHFILFYKKYRNVKKVTRELINDYKAYLDIIAGSKKSLLFTGLNEELIVSLKIGEEINYSRLSKLIYLSLFEDKKDVDSITCIVDKNPYYTFHSGSILKVFPDAKFLGMVRDPRAYIHSNRQSQNPAISKHSVAYYAITWNYYVSNLISIRSEIPSQLKIFRYEDLVVKREETIREMAEFLGIRFGRHLLEPHSDLQSLLVKEERNDKENEHFITRINALSAPINSSRLNAWEKEMSEADIRQADLISSVYGKEFGYHPRSSSGTLRRITCKLKSIPAYIRVGLFMLLNSPALYFYLNVKNKLKNERRILDKKSGKTHTKK